MRLIDADDAIYELERVFPIEDYNKVVRAISRAPTIDAVSVVRCKDCKYGSPNGKYGCSVYHYKKYETHDMKPNDYCSKGERKDDETD